MTGIPDDVIEAMARAMAERLYPGCLWGQFDGEAYARWKLAAIDALRAAEIVNYKLIGREPTEAMVEQITGKWSERAYGIWIRMHDAAPGVGKP